MKHEVWKPPGYFHQQNKDICVFCLKHSWRSILLWQSSFFRPCGAEPVRDVWQRPELFRSQREQDKNNSPLIETIMIRCIQALGVSGLSRMELFQSYLQHYENTKAYQTKENKFLSSFSGVEGLSTTGRGNAIEIATYVKKTAVWECYWHLPSRNTDHQT